MADEPIIYEFEARGADQVAGAIAKNNAALKSAERETLAAARAAEQLFKTNTALTKQRVSEEFARQSKAARDLAKAEAEAARAAEQLFRTNARLSQQRASQELKAQAAAARELEESLQRVGFAAGGFALAGTLGLKEVISGAIDARREFEGLFAALNSATQGGGEEAFAFINREVDRLRLNLPAATDAFTQLSAAAKGTELEGRGVEQIFSAIAQAGRVNNLSLDRQQKAYLAITQVISKGVVQQEELRGQLSEALPGAVQIFARALGVTTAELQKLITAGEVGLPELLKFAQQLEAETAGGVEAATQTLGASFDQLTTEFNRFQVSAGEALAGPTRAIADSASTLLKTFNGLNPTIQKTILIVGGLTVAYTLLVAAQIANNQLGITATAIETARAIKTAALTNATNALAAAQTLLAVATGRATAAQAAQAASMAATAAKAGVLALAIGGVAIAVETFRRVDAAAAETRSRIDALEGAVNRLKDAQRGLEGVDTFESLNNAVDANIQKIQEQIGWYGQLRDLLSGGIVVGVKALTGATLDGATAVEDAVDRQSVAFEDLRALIDEDIIAAFDDLKAAPGGLAAASEEEIGGLTDSVDAAIAALEEERPATLEAAAARDAYLETLRRNREELAAITQGTTASTAATEEQTKALREQLEILQEREFEDETVQLQRAVEDDQLERERQLAAEVAAIERQTEEEIAALQRANATQIAALQKQNEREIADFQRTQAEQLQATEAVFNEAQARQEEENQRQLQARQDTFNRSQENASQRFQEAQQDDQRAFQEELDARRAEAQTEFDRRRLEIDRQLQLEFADSEEDRDALRERFEEEDAIAERRAILEADLLEDERAFAEQLQSEEEAFNKSQQDAAAAFQKVQQGEALAFEETVLQPLRLQQEAEIQAARQQFEETVLLPLRIQQEDRLAAIREAKEAEIQVLREANEAAIAAVRGQSEAEIATLKAAAAETERQLERQFEDEMEARKRAFADSQRALDRQNAESIAAILRNAVDLSNAAAPLVAGARREGGPVEAGRPYWVGEAGKELFLPTSPGYVIRHDEAIATAAAWRSPTVASPGSVTVSGQGADPAVIRELKGVRRDLAALKSVGRPNQQFYFEEGGSDAMQRVFGIMRAGMQP